MPYYPDLGCYLGPRGPIAARYTPPGPSLYCSRLWPPRIVRFDTADIDVTKPRPRIQTSPLPTLLRRGRSVVRIRTMRRQGAKPRPSPGALLVEKFIIREKKLDHIDESEKSSRVSRLQERRYSPRILEDQKENKTIRNILKKEDSLKCKEKPGGKVIGEESEDEEDIITILQDKKYSSLVQEDSQEQAVANGEPEKEQRGSTECMFCEESQEKTEVRTSEGEQGGSPVSAETELESIQKTDEPLSENVKENSKIDCSGNKLREFNNLILDNVIQQTAEKLTENGEVECNGNIEQEVINSLTEGDLKKSETTVKKFKKKNKIHKEPQCDKPVVQKKNVVTLVNGEASEDAVSNNGNSNNIESVNDKAKLEICEPKSEYPVEKGGNVEPNKKPAETQELTALQGDLIGSKNVINKPVGSQVNSASGSSNNCQLLGSLKVKKEYVTTNLSEKNNVKQQSNDKGKRNVDHSNSVVQAGSGKNSNLNDLKVQNYKKPRKDIIQECENISIEKSNNVCNKNKREGGSQAKNVKNKTEEKEPIIKTDLLTNGEKKVYGFVNKENYKKSEERINNIEENNKVTVKLVRDNKGSDKVNQLERLVDESELNKVNLDLGAKCTGESARRQEGAEEELGEKEVCGSERAAAEGEIIQGGVGKGEQEEDGSCGNRAKVDRNNNSELLKSEEEGEECSESNFEEEEEDKTMENDQAGSLVKRKKKKKVIIKKKGSKIKMTPLEAKEPTVKNESDIARSGEIKRQNSKKRMSLVDDQLELIEERKTSITDEILLLEAAYLDSVIREEMRGAGRRKSSLGFPAAIPEELLEEAEMETKRPSTIKEEDKEKKVEEESMKKDNRREVWRGKATQRSGRTLGKFFRGKVRTVQEPEESSTTSEDEECDVNCHWKCRKLMPNLCGVNQKLIAEALAKVRRSRSFKDSPQSSLRLTINSSESCESDAPLVEPGRVTPPATTLPRFREYNINDFQFLKVLGKGSFGKVLLAELKGSGCYYAVKALKKDVVLEDDDVECTLIERKVLTLGTSHPYFCHLFCTFQTESHLFFVMEYLNGGDLMFHIQESGRFDEGRARFYAAEIVSGLKFLHKWGIVYRDLKLDNVLLDFEGHVRIADFGMCKLQIYLDRTTDTFCGTPDYMAPEIIKGLHYNQCVDWWSFGVLLYEMLVGQSPFSGCDEDDLFWSICNEKPQMHRYMSSQSKAILFALLEKDWTKRLGFGQTGAADVMNDDFFSGLNWFLLEKRQLDPPFKPTVKHPLDTKYFDKAFTQEKARLTPVDKRILESMDQSQFAGFSYTNPNATE